MTQRIAITLAIATVLVLGFWGVFEILCRASGLPDFERVKPGMAREEVLRLLGKPDASYANQITADWYERYSHPPRWSAPGGILVFIRGDHIAYIYLDQQKRVDYVFVGGS